MKQQLPNSVKLSKVKKTIRILEKNIAPKKDCDISFEFFMLSFFPNIMENIKQEFNRNYIAGYNAAKEEEKLQKEEKVGD